MAAFLRRFEPYAFALFRITVGGLFLFHGLQKLFGMYGGTQVPYLSRAGAAGIIELVGGVLVALGAWTVPTAFIASGEMAFAYYLGHYGRATWPIQNGGELAALYCAAFLYISTHGPGTFSLDTLMRRR
jgi:putative oxidoreductase